MGGAKCFATKVSVHLVGACAQQAVRQGNVRRPFIACDHLMDLLLDLVVFLKEVEMPNFLHLVGHVKLVLL
jgi:hypothetical protein